MYSSGDHYEVEHSFDLRGAQLKDWFLGCNRCWFRFDFKEAVAVSKSPCPDCGNELKLYLITEKDLLGNESNKRTI